MDSTVKDFDKLPANWEWEKFVVVDAGRGQIALHNTNTNRFCRMSGSDMDSGNPTDVDKLNPKWAYEPFTVVADGGIGEVALYNTYHKRFWRMAGNDMVRSDEMEKLGPPPQHSWLRFKPKLVMSKADADKAAIAIAKPPPFADSAALKTAVDNCLTAVPSGLDCCKPKSEGGGGADCGAGKHAAIGDWDTSKVTNMRTLFAHAKTFNQPIGGWDTSQVTDMWGMLHHAAAFNQQIGNWDTSKVTTMRYMLHNARSFNQPIGKWDTSSVGVGGGYGMAGMFWGASSFNQPIGDWDTSKVPNMQSMFSDSAFNQPIGNWDVSSVTEMAGMFHRCPFNQPIGNWDTSKVTNMRQMFQDNKAFNQDISGMKVHWRNEDMFKGADAYNRAHG
jgi:surface protein